MEGNTYLSDHKSGSNFRHWESVDFSISKLVQVEGDMSQGTPRLGAYGKFEVAANSISFSGIEWHNVQSNPEISRYYNKDILKEYDNVSDKEACLVGPFSIGRGDTDIDRSLEDVLQTMYPGEKSEVSVRINLDMSKRQHLLKLLDAQIEQKKPENCIDHWITFQFTCKLLPEGYDNSLALYDWTVVEKVTEAQMVYESAVTLFQVQI